MENNNLKQLLDIVDSKANIVDIVSDYVSLEKKGQNHVGLCPFHSDSNPSMSVSESKGIFKCFSCGAGGNAVTFIKDREGISFIEALKKVCTKYDIDYKPFINEKVIKIDPKVSKGWEINKEAFNFFSYSLDNSNQEVKDYLSSRGLDKEIQNHFKIGYSGNGSSLSKFLISKGYTEEEIIEYGLAKRKEDTTLVDYFINRIIFSIEDINGNIIGFSGRVLNNESKYAKYLNSPETPNFKKSNILYNLNKSRSYASLKKELIVVEGFMDVIALYKTDIHNAIATMGTAFTNNHFKTINSLSKNILLAFDSDAPGINATINTGKTLVSEGFNVNVITIPSGKDFDELLKSGKESVINTISNRKSFIEFYKDTIFKAAESVDMIKRSSLIEKLLQVTSLYDDNKILVSTIINDIKEKFSIEKDILDGMYLSNIKSVKPQQQAYFPEEDYVPQDPLKKSVVQTKPVKNIVDGKHRFIHIERLIMALVIQNEEYADYLRENQMSFISNSTFKLWLELKHNNNDIKDPVLMNIFDELKELDVKSSLEDIGLFIDDINDFAFLVKKSIENYKRTSIESLSKAIAQSSTEDEFKHNIKMLNDIEAL